MHDFGPAAHHDINSVTDVPLVKDLFTRLEVLLGDAHRAPQRKLNELRGQEQIERPGDSHLEPAPPPGHLQQIDCPPKKPSDEPIELDSQNLRNRRATAERAHLAEPLE